MFSEKLQLQEDVDKAKKMPLNWAKVLPIIPSKSMNSSHHPCLCPKVVTPAQKYSNNCCERALHPFLKELSIKAKKEIRLFQSDSCLPWSYGIGQKTWENQDVFSRLHPNPLLQSDNSKFRSSYSFYDVCHQQKNACCTLSGFVLSLLCEWLKLSIQRLTSNLSTS